MTMLRALDSWCLEYTRPTNSTIVVTPAEASINMGVATYPTGVTQDIVIEASAGDQFQVTRVDFLSVSAGANGDFFGSVKKEAPSASTITTAIKPSAPYTTAINLTPGDKYRFSAKCVPTGTGSRTAIFRLQLIYLHPMMY
ncbi:MAG: hypothetical protein R3E08_07795 [Thiotrichaceae bacterium]